MIKARANARASSFVTRISQVIRESKNNGKKIGLSKGTMLIKKHALITSTNES